MRAVGWRAIPYTRYRTRYTHQASAGALRMRAMSHSARTIFVTSSLVLVTCLGGQTALAQTAQTTSSFGAPVASSTEQAPRESQASQSLGQIPRLSPPQEPNFFKSTLTDFKHLGSKDTLAWLTIGTLAATFATPADLSVTARVSGAQMEQVHAGNIIGGKEFQFGASLAALTIGKITGNERAADVAGKVLRGQIMAQALTGVIKMTAQRTRPDGSDTRSFPSGHTSVTFASATVLQREFGWKVGIPAYAVAAYVGTARIEKQKHFLSDVAMGAAIGILAGRTVTIGSGERKFAVTPVATPGGAAVNFSWVGNSQTP